MRNSPLPCKPHSPFPSTHGNGSDPRPTDLTAAAMKTFGQDWIAAGTAEGASKQTLAARRFIVDKLTWFLDHRKAATCGTREVRLFLAYVQNSHETDEGRWGSDTRGKVAVRPWTARTYFKLLKTWFAFLVAEELIETDPMQKVKPPILRVDQVLPFSDEQIEDLAAAAKRSRHAKRDSAIFWLLLDSMLRASELCNLRRKDLNLDERYVRILGKGNKARTVPFGLTTRRALWEYLRDEGRDDEDPVFMSERDGAHLTPSGLLQLFERLGEAASIQGVRCSPHTARHSGATRFLRNGGHELTLMQLLGHTSLVMTSRYVKLVQADIQAEHRKYSPADGIKRRK